MKCPRDDSLFFILYPIILCCDVSLKIYRASYRLKISFRSCSCFLLLSKLCFDNDFFLLSRFSILSLYICCTPIEIFMMSPKDSLKSFTLKISLIDLGSIPWSSWSIGFPIIVYVLPEPVAPYVKILTDSYWNTHWTKGSKI